MSKVKKYAKVIKEYDGCFTVNKFYEIVIEEEPDDMALCDEKGKIYWIPKNCLELTEEK
jgi:hypothetical protein